MEAMGVFSSWVTALMKLSCCSLRRISRIRKLVFTIIPAISRAKKTTPRKSRTPSRQLRMIQPTFSPTASSTKQTPKTTKKAVARRRLLIRMAGFYRVDEEECVGRAPSPAAVDVESEVGCEVCCFRRSPVEAYLDWLTSKAKAAGARPTQYLKLRLVRHVLPPALRVLLPGGAVRRALPGKPDAPAPTWRAPRCRTS